MKLFVVTSDFARKFVNFLAFERAEASAKQMAMQD